MDSRDPEAAAGKPMSGRTRKAPRRATAAVVLGSVAALGGAGSAVAQTTGHPGPDRQRRQSRRVDALPAGERALLGRVFSRLSGQAPAVAGPILAAGVGQGTITQTEADRFLARLASARTAEDGSAPGGGAPSAASPPTSPAARALFQRVFAAIQAELPLIALPLVMAAVAEGSITEAQAARLRERFSQGPRLGFGLVMRNARMVGATRLP